MKRFQNPALIFSAALSLLVLSVFTPSVAFGDEKPKEGTKAAAPAGMPSQEEMMKAWMAAATPGEAHKKLEPVVGSFTVQTKMWMDPSKPPEETAGTSENKWVLGGRFVEQQVEGTAMGQPFSGIGYTGYDNYKKKYVGTWTDSMGTMIMTSTGTADASGKKITFWSTMDDVVHEEDHEGQKPGDDRGQRPPYLRDVGPGSRREDVQDPGGPIHAEKVAQSFFSASIACLSDCRLLKNPAHGSGLRSRSAKLPILKSAALRDAFTSDHSSGVETGACGRRRTE